ncbi:hypothetical protein SRHO_G00142010 [Serrasalmus rhombeus]
MDCWWKSGQFRLSLVKPRSLWAGRDGPVYQSERRIQNKREEDGGRESSGLVIERGQFRLGSVWIWTFAVASEDDPHINCGCSLDSTSVKLLTFEDDPTLFSRTQGASPPPKAPGLNINPLKPVETLTDFHKLTLEIKTF